MDIEEIKKRITDAMTAEAYVLANEGKFATRFRYYEFEQGEAPYYEYTINLAAKTICLEHVDELIQYECVMIPNNVLQFFDKLGFDISLSCATKTKQRIDDWWE